MHKKNKKVYEYIYKWNKEYNYVKDKNSLPNFLFAEKC